MDYYKVLGLDRNASETDIKSAYRKLALKWHPDKHQHHSKEEASNKFKSISEAYATLSDPSLKSKYDDNLFGGGSRSAGFNSAFHRSNFNHDMAFDIFEHFFAESNAMHDMMRQSMKMHHETDLDFDFPSRVDGRMGRHERGQKRNGVGGFGSFGFGLMDAFNDPFFSDPDSFFSGSGDLVGSTDGRSLLEQGTSNQLTSRNPPLKKSTSIVKGKGNSSGADGRGPIVGRSSSSSTSIVNGKRSVVKETILTYADGTKEITREST